MEDDEGDIENSAASASGINRQQRPSVKNRMSYSGPTYCGDCQHQKDRNTYHCEDCDVCIEDFDHHCIFFSKCIGGGNITFFYASIAMVFVVFTSFGAMVIIDAVNR